MTNEVSIDAGKNATDNAKSSDRSLDLVVYPRESVQALASLLSAPVAARSISCQAGLTKRDLLVCLRGGLVTAVFTCTFLLAAARSYIVHIIAPHSTQFQGLWCALEPTFWACAVTSIVLLILYSMENKRTLVVAPDGLLISSEITHGVDTNMLVPWSWLSRVSVVKSAFRFGETELQLQTKYGTDYSLRWDDVQANVIAHTLIAAVRTLAPQAELDLSDIEFESELAQRSFTELWLQSLSDIPQRLRVDSLPIETSLKDGRFVVSEIIGSGGQGTAYLARDTMNDKAKIVLKEYVLPTRKVSDPQQLSHGGIENEIALLSSLDHPNIVKLIDHFVEDYRGYLVMELIEGSQLEEVVAKGGPLNEQAVVSIAWQVCQILVYLHGLTPQVVHQDISPDNLILLEDGTVKLVDFNVARRILSESSSAVMVGKTSYMAPEQLRGQATSQSDIYSLGCTLHYLLTGQHSEPLVVSNPSAIMHGVSEQLNSIIAKATAQDPCERFASAIDLAAALDPNSRLLLR